jgi:hypothetical protein
MKASQEIAILKNKLEKLQEKNYALYSHVAECDFGFGGWYASLGGLQRLLAKGDVETAKKLVDSLLADGCDIDHELLRDKRLAELDARLAQSESEATSLTAQVAKLEEDLKRGLSVEFQRTHCCVCSVYKHTPVRNDNLGGYVCGGCLETAYEDSTERAENAEAKLSALKTSDKVSYRLDYVFKRNGQPDFIPVLNEKFARTIFKDFAANSPHIRDLTLTEIREHVIERVIDCALASEKDPQ